MESTLSPHDALASLIWQIELGATEAIGDAPVNRYELPEKAAKTAVAPKAEPPRAAVAAPALVAGPDPAAAAQAAAAAAMDLEALRAALGAYPHCELKRGARNLVFSDGNPAARVMIIGEAPGRDEDQQGKPFVGRAGQLLDRMLAAIGLMRGAEAPQEAVYITNVLPWRPPQNRDPNAEEIAMMRPFVARHVALVNPAAVVLMGNISCEAGLGQRGITRLRGRWAEAYGKPALPMFHPAYLLRTPAAKREAWADLLALKARLREMGA
ncbi:uracil-DNA glycosylase, family 4 [Roseovarius mucosus DSM 17069]|uniref:Type-4 uracil-DNA glycosylase n=1 Tax=Roseovarius mucosus DSM 17069 TaxID=1288298 RepID=A0A0A0HF76_9RHOB|nr:uracil-DNA glycosylase [Roseovarius mucosus]KGM86357.1 uracil-DNA glycosylase, family 4 [Roseovarius mucosus DSM 17069]